MELVELEAQSLADLIGHSLSARDGLRDAGQEPVLWYRGVRCDTYQLIPKLLREQRTADQVFDRENRLLTRFRQRSMAYWPAGRQQDEWEHLFAMQHYGLPTRLLDWSENLLVAAFFAVESPEDHVHDAACIPAVFVVAPVAWNRATPVLSEYGPDVHVLTTADEDADVYMPMTKKRRVSSAVAIYGSHNSDRIVAQRGNFFVWGKDVRPMEDLASDLTCESALWKIRLLADRESLLSDLQDLGFTETIVYPELPSLATELSRTVRWKENLDGHA